MTETEKRARLKELMAGTAANEPRWHYAFRRPLTLPTLEQALHGSVQSDCSFGVKSLCHLVPGVPDPTGCGYNGWGNSTSIYLHLPHVTLAKAKVGDIVVFGREGSQHAVMVYAAGSRTPRTVKVWSHGQERGPVIVTLEVEQDAHPGQTVTICRTVAPDPAPPKPPHWVVVARGLPPLWAWISWKDHGSPKQWRPAQVPRLIPPLWWARYRRHVGAGDP